jgi:hypothetical protein
MINKDDDEHETFQDWAERRWRENGEVVPERGSPEWQVKYEAFIDYAFEDLSKRSKKENAQKKRARRRGATR